MDYLEAMNLLDNLLQKHNITWSNTDIDVLQDDDNGDVVVFLEYYEKPVYQGIITWDLIKNLYNEYKSVFKIDDIGIVNDELRVRYIDTEKYKEEQYLYY